MKYLKVIQFKILVYKFHVDQISNKATKALWKDSKALGMKLRFNVYDDDKTSKATTLVLAPTSTVFCCEKLSNNGCLSL